MPSKLRRTYPDLKTFLADARRVGITQKEIAARLQIRQPLLSELKNRRLRPSLKMALRLSEEFGIPIESFL